MNLVRRRLGGVGNRRLGGQEKTDGRFVFATSRECSVCTGTEMIYCRCS